MAATGSATRIKVSITDSGDVSYTGNAAVKSRVAGSGNKRQTLRSDTAASQFGRHSGATRAPQGRGSAQSANA